jgi:hypothetical protein
MSLEYTARAIGIADSQDGKKVIVVRTICGRTVKVICEPNQTEYVRHKIGAPLDS